MDPAVLLQSRDEDSPSGENLEYDPIFTEMELAAQPGEERQIGDEITRAEDPDYSEVAEKALAVLEKSHDLRAAVYLADALLHAEGLTGFADVTTYIRGCLETYWDTCHPELDEDDDNDPTMRINTVQGLCGQPGGMGGASAVYRSLRRTPLTDSRGFGRFSLRDIEVAEGQAEAPPDMETPPDKNTISAAFRDSDGDALSAYLEAARTAEADIRAIAAVFDEQTPGRGPELDPLIKLLGLIAQKLRDYTGGEVAPDQPEEAAAQDVAETGGAAAPAAKAVGGISSPADVSNALDRIVAYYQRNEPSSPVPVLLLRAKRLVNADFMTIIKDMAPDGADNVRLIGGIEEDE